MKIAPGSCPKCEVKAYLELRILFSWQQQLFESAAVGNRFFPGVHPARMKLIWLVLLAADARFAQVVVSNCQHQKT